MEIKVINNFCDPCWDNFVDKSNNGTLFHTLRFLNYHKKNKFNFLNLAFYKNSKMIGVLPGGLINNLFVSPIGASYGSFVVGDISFQEYEEIIDTFLIFTKKKNINKIHLTPPPIIYLKNFNQVEQFILEYKGFKVKKHAISNVIDLKNFKSIEDILKHLPKNRRNNIHISQKNNIAMQMNNDYNSFYKMLLENKKKFDTYPTHSLEELKMLSKLFPKRIKLFMAYSARQPISGVLAFITNNKSLLIFYICQYYKYQNLKGVSRLLYEIIVWSKKNRYRFIDLGISMDTLSGNLMEPSRSLIFFKESVNSKGFLRTSYVYEHL